LESALLRLARALLHPTGEGGPSTGGEESVPDMQVTLRSGANLLQFRELTVSVLHPLMKMSNVGLGKYVNDSRAITWYCHKRLSTI
jgi:DNA replication licensing factor MCM5